ncbi:MAG: FAD binding domain-containing protein [Acetobacteraceae bacterium]|nr:FAD binding domain-containing protein [Acetobacteraceae bacterium]
MDLNTIEELMTPGLRNELPPWRTGDAWLAGGTWLFSEPQPALRRLIDLTTLGWQPIAETPDGLEIAATCTIADLAAFGSDSALPAAALVLQCCEALLGSFKVWNMATVGGNICMSLPAGPMISLATALDAEAVIWTESGRGPERRCRIPELVTGPHENSLQPGDLLRAIRVPLRALHWKTAFRRISLNPIGRSGALLIGTLDSATDGFALTVTAATRRPARLVFPGVPDAGSLGAKLDQLILPSAYCDDVHGSPDWRQHVTRLFAEEIRRELGAAVW